MAFPVKCLILLFSFTGFNLPNMPFPLGFNFPNMPIPPEFPGRRRGRPSKAEFAAWNAMAGGSMCPNQTPSQNQVSPLQTTLLTPAAQASIQTPSGQAAQTQPQSPNRGPQCPICLSPQPTGIIRLCGHLVCMACFDVWMNEGNAKCPTTFCKKLVAGRIWFLCVPNC